MIKLTKHEEPAVLRKNGAKWLAKLEDRVAKGEVATEHEKTRYRHADIKAALVKETFGKCAYCESYLLHITYGDVEHISPKSLDIKDTFRWQNLTLACDVCNTNKADEDGIVDPYIDDPESCFRFIGPIVYASKDSDKAELTHLQLDLNRLELVKSRLRRIDYIDNYLKIINSKPDGKVKKALIDDLVQVELADDTEYAAFARSFVAAEGQDILPQPARR